MTINTNILRFIFHTVSLFKLVDISVISIQHDTNSTVMKAIYRHNEAHNYLIDSNHFLIQFFFIYLNQIQNQVQFIDILLIEHRMFQHVLY